MRCHIHARRRRGRTVYRLWDPLTGGYLTPEMGHYDLFWTRLCLLLLEAADRHLDAVDHLMARAEARGTSCGDVAPSDLNDGWTVSEPTPQPSNPNPAPFMEDARKASMRGAITGVLSAIKIGYKMLEVRSAR